MKYCVLTVILRTDLNGDLWTLLGCKQTGEIGQQTINSSGGKIDYYDVFGNALDRNPEDAAKREPYEEMGVVLFSHDITHQANVTFYNEGRPTYQVAIFVARFGPKADVKYQDTESMKEVGWRRISELPYDRMAEGDRHWFPQVFAGEQFDATVHYEKEMAGFIKAHFGAFTGTRRFPIPKLPDPGKRWIPSRKQQVVQAVLSGLVPKMSVLARYDMSEQEFDNWTREFSN